MLGAAMTEPLLSARALSWRRGNRTVLADVSITLAPGEFVALVGPNGAGKTSLLRTLAGLQKLPAPAAVHLDHRAIAAWSASERARRLAYLPQSRPLAWPVSVAGLAGLGRFAFGQGRLTEADAAAVNQALVDCGIVELATRRCDEISGGELARAHLARVFAAQAPVLLVDEPIAALDPRAGLDVMALLAAYAGKGGAVLAAIHDLPLAARYCSRVVVLEAGVIRADGPPPAALNSDLLAQVFAVAGEFDGHGQLQLRGPAGASRR
jgi:iron complex transport system ATP-binding protein